MCNAAQCPARLMMAPLDVAPMPPPGYTTTAAEGAEVAIYLFGRLLAKSQASRRCLLYTYLIQYTGQKQKGNFVSTSKKHIQSHTLLQQKKAYRRKQIKSSCLPHINIPTFTSTPRPSHQRSRCPPCRPAPSSWQEQGTRLLLRAAGARPPCQWRSRVWQ
jgi:hypothetical protein